MSQLKESRGSALGAMTVGILALGVSVMALACGSERDDGARAVSREVFIAPSTPPPPASAPAVVREPTKEVQEAKAAKEAKSTVLGAVEASAVVPIQPVEPAPAATGLTVKRFVLTTGVRDREPVSGEGPLAADGKPIYAFFELVNRDSAEQRVSVTFERKGSPDRVGHATLTVPANVPRHRTWANTRFIREPGTWEAVLWNASGVALSRASFEVAAP